MGQQLVLLKKWSRKKTSLQVGLLTDAACPFPYATSLNLVAFEEKRE